MAAAVVGTLGELGEMLALLAAAAGIDADHLQAVEEGADHRQAEQLLHGNEGDAWNLGSKQDAVDLGVMFAGEQRRSALGQIFSATQLDLHAADPAHAPHHRPGIAMQQAAQQHGRGNRHQDDAEQRRQHRQGVEVEVEGQRTDHDAPPLTC